MQQFTPFIRDDQQWLKDGETEIGPFKLWGEASRYIKQQRKAGSTPGPAP